MWWFKKENGVGIFLLLLNREKSWEDRVGGEEGLRLWQNGWLSTIAAQQN